MSLLDMWKEIETLLDVGRKHIVNEEYVQALPLIVEAQGLVDTCLEKTNNSKEELARISKVVEGCIAVQSLLKITE